MSPAPNIVLRQAWGRVERREDKFSSFQVIQTPGGENPGGTMRYDQHNLKNQQIFA